VKRAALLALMTLVCACHAKNSPQAVLSRFLRETERGQFRTAYARMSTGFQKQCNLLCFVRLVSAQSNTNRYLLDELRNGSPQVVYEVEARLVGHSLLLWEQRDRSVSGSNVSLFLFAKNPLDVYPQDTPEEALQSFVRAFLAKRFDVLLRFVPKSMSKQMTEEVLKKRFSEEPLLKRQVEGLRSHLGERVLFEGDTARLVWGAEQEAVLRLEDGKWKVQKLE